MLRPALTLILASAVLKLAAQDAPPALSTRDADAFRQLMATSQGQPPVILGRVEVNTYFSPNGSFGIPIPIQPEMGGVITDSENLVTFEDAYLTHISIASFPLDPTQRWELSTDGPRDFLLNFFGRHVLTNYREAFKNVRVEPNGRFLANANGGSFIAYILVPGGSNFMARIPLVANDPKPREAKYGFMLFVRNNFIFIISTEYAERAIEGSAYRQTSDHEDLVLRSRLLDLASRMTFPKPLHN